ncbi:MAG: hypothetical protein KDB22_26350 [Planctomycetales bacterium]|nr:hypothetical protein [Planctomycetales bacterium]
MRIKLCALKDRAVGWSSKHDTAEGPQRQTKQSRRELGGCSWMFFLFSVLQPLWIQAQSSDPNDSITATRNTSRPGSSPSHLSLMSFPTGTLPAASGAPSPSTSQIASPQVVAWLTKMIHENLPSSYENDKKWGKQKEVWNGVEIWREAGRIETKRKKKMVNAGTWTKYRIDIVEPENRLHVTFNRLEMLPDGRIAFDVVVDCSLDVYGRLSQWARDVQVISISANADAACRLTLIGTVALQMNMLKLPPDIAIKPHVDYAHVDLTYYRVRRISQVGGDFAKVLGNGLRGVVDEKLEDMNAKLVEKINAQLDKHNEKMSFSPQDWLRTRLPLPSTVASPAAAVKLTNGNDE